MASKGVELGLGARIMVHGAAWSGVHWIGGRVIQFSSVQVGDRTRRRGGLGVWVEGWVIGCVVHRIRSRGIRDGAWFGVKRRHWCVVGSFGAAADAAFTADEV